MEEPLLVSSASLQDDEIGEYSEWRLFLGVSRFDHVGVNSGFQNRDFQTNQGTSIIVDPEVYRKLQDEASAIWTKLFRTKMELVVVWYLCVFLYFSWLIVSEVTLVAILVRYALSGVLGGILLFVLVAHYLRNNADSRTTAVVDSYKEHFLKAYGVELGYGVELECGNINRYSYKEHFCKAYGLHLGPGVLNIPDQGRPAVLIRAIYLRRPRRATVGEVLTVGDHEVQDGGGLPPTFIDCMLPGDIHVNEKDNNATMKVDAETWALLQAVHQDNMLASPYISGFPDVFSYITMFGLLFWVSQATMAQNGPLFVRLVFLLICLLICLWLLRRIIYNTLKEWNFGTRYEEVTRQVNEALQKDASRSHLAVEFHTSDLPGREKKDSRRYQFVKRGLTPKKAME